MSKYKSSSRDPYLAFLEYRTTPLDVGISPSQLLICRRRRSILPSASTSLKAEVPNLLIVHSEMELSHKRQKKYYNSEVKTLPPLEVNNLVRIQQPNKLWKPAMVTQKHNDRSYTIQTQDGTIYRRNSRHLLKSNETNFLPILQ